LSSSVCVCQLKIKTALFFNESQFGRFIDFLKDIIYNLGNFLFEYNHLRRHGGLKYITPYEKLEKVTELLS